MNSEPSSEQREAFLDAEHLPETLKRLDDLIEQTQSVEKLRAGLGMQLALSMAKELREYKPLGFDTTELVAGWVERFGQDTVDVAVGIAREFLTRPDELVKEFAARLNSISTSAPETDAS